MRPFRPIAALSLAAVLVPPATASAQDARRQPTQVPIELASALVSMPYVGGAKATRIFVGVAPDGIATAAIPPKPVSILGGMAAGPYRAIVLVYPATDSDPGDSYMKFLEGAGWARPKVEMQRSGFVPAGDLRMRPGMLCRDSAHVSVLSVSGAPSGSAWVRADFYPERGMGPCTMPSRTEFVPELVFPALEAPPGARSIGGSGGGGSFDAREISTTLETTLTTAQLLAHYATQLQKGGWTTGTPLSGDGLATQRVTARDAKGREWLGALTVITLGDELHVTVHMARRS